MGDGKESVQAADLHRGLRDHYLPGTSPPTPPPSVCHFPSLHNPLYFWGCAPEIGVCWEGGLLLRTMLLLMHLILLCLLNEGPLASGRQEEGGEGEWTRPLLHSRPLYHRRALFMAGAASTGRPGVNLPGCWRNRSAPLSGLPPSTHTEELCFTPWLRSGSYCPPSPRTFAEVSGDI